MQFALRQQFQKAYSSRVLTLQKFYQEKQSSLHQTLQDSYIRVLESDLLKTMVSDQTTLLYAKDMIGQLFEKVVAEERELVIENLGMTISKMKGDLVHSEQILKRFKGEIERLNSLLNAKEEEFDKTKLNYQNKSSRLMSQEETLKEQLQKTLFEKDMEIKELKDELKVMNNQLNSFKLDITERDTRLKNIEKSERQMLDNTKEFSMMKKEMELEIKELELEIVRLNKQKSNQDELRSGVIKMLENKLKEVESNSRQIQETLKAQFTQKSLGYKKKIQQQKFRVSEVLSKSSIVEKKLEYSNRNVLELESKLTSLLQQNERSLSEYKSSRDRERVELEKKFEYQLKEFQSHYQRLLQSKIEDVEEQALHHLNSMKQCEYQYQQILEKKAEEYDNNYVSRKEYERVLKQKQQVIEKQLMNIHDKDLDTKQLQFRITMEEDKKHQLERELDYLKSKMNEYQNVFKDEKLRRKALETEKESLKAQNKKYKRLVGENEQKFKEINKDVEEKMSVGERMKEKCLSLEIQLKSVKEGVIEKTQKMNKLLEKVAKDEQYIRQLNSIFEKTKQQNTSLINQKEYFQTKSNQLSDNIDSISQKFVKEQVKSKDQQETILSLRTQNTKFAEIIEGLRKKQEQQSQTLKISMGQMTQKYTDFKSVASKLEIDLKTKDDLIAQITSSNQLLSKRKKKLEESFIKLFKQVSQLSKCLVGVKETVVSSNKLYSKEVELLISSLNSRVDETLKLKQANFASEKSNLKDSFNKEIELIKRVSKQNCSKIIESSEERYQSFKSQVSSLNELISELRSQAIRLRQQLLTSESSFKSNIQTSSNQIFNLESQYTILQKQYNVLKQSYKSLINQHEQLQSTHRASTKTLAEKQEIIKQNKSEIVLMEKQLQDTLNQNDLLKDKKNRLEGEINEMRSIVSKAAKGTESEGIKLAKILDLQTRELTKRVDMLKKMGMNTYSATKQMLRG